MTAATATKRPPAILIVPAVLVALLALTPLLYLLVRSGEAGLTRIGAIVLREQTLWLVGRSLGLAAAVTTASVVIGVALAALVQRTSLPGRRVFGVLAPLPLAIPSYVAAFAWISWQPGLAGFIGAMLVLTLCCYPFVYLPVHAALRRTDPATEEVARSLGRSPWQAFREATLPQLGPSVAGGGLIVALYVLSDFGGVSTMRFDSFTRVIHTSYQASFDRTPAAVLGVVLVVLTVALTWGESHVRGRDTTRIGGQVARTPERARLGRWTVPALLAAVMVPALALGLPIVSLVHWSVTGLSSGVDVSRLLASTGATVLVAVLGALACVFAAIPIGVLTARHRGRLVHTVEQAAYAGHALPGLVVALALVFLGVRLVPWLYQRTSMLVIAYLVLFLPLAIGAVRGAVMLSSPRAEEVARTLGESPFGVLRRVTLPLALPGLAAGAALVMLACMKELPATILLRPTGVDTLATRLWTHTGAEAYAAAAPYGLMLVVLAVLPTVALMTLTDPDRESR